MRARLVLAVLPAALLGVTAAGALAAPKPITGAYSATAPVPGAATSCDGAVPQSVHSMQVKLPRAGVLKVELSGFAGDWDLFVRSAGRTLGAAETGGIGPVDAAVEKLSIKVKRPATITIESCNWAGGPTGAVKYSFS